MSEYMSHEDLDAAIKRAEAAEAEVERMNRAYDQLGEAVRGERALHDCTTGLQRLAARNAEAEVRVNWKRRATKWKARAQAAEAERDLLEAERDQALAELGRGK